MKPTTLIVIIVSIVASFAAGYLTCSLRNERREAKARQNAEEFQKIEKKFDDILTLPEDMRPKKSP